MNTKHIVLTDLDKERQALMILKNLYAERLLNVENRIAEIDKNK